jgi:RecA-family ATPase
MLASKKPLTKSNKTAEPLDAFQNFDAEESVLGAILLDPDALPRILGKITKDVFAFPSHKTIFDVCCKLHGLGKITDLMTVTTWLIEHGQLDFIGGKGKLVQIVDRTISSVNIERYCELINQKYVAREMLKLADTIKDNAFNHSAAADAPQLIREVKEQLGYFEKLASEHENICIDPRKQIAQKIKQIKELEMTDIDGAYWAWRDLSKQSGIKLHELKQYALVVESNKPLESLSFAEFAEQKFVDREWLVDGLIKSGALSLLVAESKVGKSLMHYDLAYCVTKGLNWCGFRVPEVGKTLIIQTDEPTTDAQQRIKVRGLDECEGRIIYRDFTALNVGMLKKMIIDEGYQFVIIDSLTSISRSLGCSMNDTEFSYFMYGLKDIASDTGASILLIHHTNKSQFKDTLDKIANNKSIVTASSCIFSLSYPKDKKNINERVLTVSGSRWHPHQMSWLLELNFEDNSYSFLGDCDTNGSFKDEQRTDNNQDTKAQILNYLDVNCNDSFDVESVWKSIPEAKKDFVQKCLRELSVINLIIRKRVGKKYFYRSGKGEENLLIDLDGTENSTGDQPSDNVITNTDKIDKTTHNQGLQTKDRGKDLTKNKSNDVVTSTNQTNETIYKQESQSKVQGDHKSINTDNLQSEELKPKFKIGDSVIYTVDNTPCQITAIIKRSTWQKDKGDIPIYKYIVNTFGVKTDTIFDGDQVDEIYLSEFF